MRQTFDFGILRSVDRVQSSPVPRTESYDLLPFTKRSLPKEFEVFTIWVALAFDDSSMVVEAMWMWQ